MIQDVEKLTYDEMIFNNSGLVGLMVKSYYKYGYTYEELLDVGDKGLKKAAESFDPTRKVKFSTYASNCIKNEILMYYRKYDKFRSRIISFDTVIASDKEGNSKTLLEDLSEQESLKTVNAKEKLQDISNFGNLYTILLNNLKTKELYMYTCTLCGQTQYDVADFFHLSRSYLSRICSKVLKKLKKYYSEKIEFEKNFILKKNLDSFNLFIATEHQEEITEIVKGYFNETKYQDKYVIRRADNGLNLLMLGDDKNLISIVIIVDLVNRFNQYLLYLDNVDQITYQFLYEDQLNDFNMEIEKNDKNKSLLCNNVYKK